MIQASNSEVKAMKGFAAFWESMKQYVNLYADVTRSFR